MRDQTRRDGFALPVALFALVVVGVLVTGGFFVARQETRIGVASQQAGTAFYMAERGITDFIENFSAPDYASLGTWDSTTVVDTLSQGTVRVRVTRVSASTFFLDAESDVDRGGEMLGGAARRLGLLAKLNAATIDPPAALTTVGTLKFGGSAIIDGRDQDPSFWPAGDCTTTNTDKPGIVMDDTTNIDWSGNETSIRNNQLFGTSDLGQDATLNSDSMLVFGDQTFADLTELATIEFTSAPGTIEPAVAGGQCDTGTMTNWGEPKDPTHACYNYFPVVYLNNPGTTWNFSTGRGQGILLVEGSMKVTGQFEFYGPVIIKGTLSTQGGGGTQHFHGGVMAANVELDDNSVLGTADIVYSSCALERAILNSSLTYLRPITQRSWVDLSNVVN